LLVFGCEQGQDGRRLYRQHHRIPVAKVVAGGIAAPDLPGYRRERVLGRTTAPLGLGQQRLVVLLRGLEGIRTDDGGAWVVAVAVAPGSGARRVLPDRGIEDRTPLHLDPLGAVAAEVERVLPQVLVFVEVLGSEQVDGERLDSRGSGTVPCGAGLDDGQIRIRGRPAGCQEHRADERIMLQVIEQVLPVLRCRGAEVQRHARRRQADRERGTAPDAVESGVGYLLRAGRERLTQQGKRRKVGQASTDRHDDSSGPGYRPRRSYTV